MCVCESEHMCVSAHECVCIVEFGREGGGALALCYYVLQRSPEAG